LSRTITEGNAIDRFLVDLSRRHQYHASDVQPVKISCLSLVGAGRDCPGLEEPVLFGQSMYGLFIERDEVNVLSCTGLRNRRCRDRATQKGRIGRAVRQ
jgi:hypothetical protein